MSRYEELDAQLGLLRRQEEELRIQEAKLYGRSGELGLELKEVARSIEALRAAKDTAQGEEAATLAALLAVHSEWRSLISKRARRMRSRRRGRSIRNGRRGRERRSMAACTRHRTI